MSFSENGPYKTITWRVRQRTLEALLPHLERAMDAPFEDREVQIELGNIHNAARSTLQTDV